MWTAAERNKQKRDIGCDPQNSPSQHDRRDPMRKTDTIVERALNTIRFLAADAVQQAKSGHPGMPMGAAAMGYALWMRHLRFNPKNPDWPDRDRFVLSGGHGSMLQYALLYLTGYDVALSDLVAFRQWGSKTPGHPERGTTPGVEVTTGPLGQGLANSVGLAIAEAHLANTFNRDGYKVVDHYTYAIVTDGDLMEGISYEAASLAGHFRLGKLVLLYDDNKISIDGTTDRTFTEDIEARFTAQGWHVVRVTDGNDVDAIDRAIALAKDDPRPSIVICRTHIGYGLPTKQDSEACHGAPVGEEELAEAKRRAGWPVEPKFYVPEDVLQHFRGAVPRGERLEQEWRETFVQYSEEYPGLAREYERRMAGDLPEGWDSGLPVFAASAKGMPTRTASGKTINALAQRVPELMGGSADLTGSNKTWIDCSDAFQSDNPGGRNIYFGVREHAMGGVVNGIAAHGGMRPYAGTFLVFSDYMKPALRISALSKHPSIWIYTHDSIGLGEDGPTHQPVEHLASLRAVPGLVVIRPADANEVVEAWRVAMRRTEGPTLLALTRQTVPVLDRDTFAPASGLHRGAYVLKDYGDSPDIILMASGSEVQLAIGAAEALLQCGVAARVVSFPSWELFEAQGGEYRETVLTSTIAARIAIEAGVAQGWERWVGDDGDIVAMDRFGASAPYPVLFEKFGFNVEAIVERALRIVEKAR